MFTESGKRRMLLEADREWLLKVPRILRRRIIGKFRVGDLLRVAVTEERDPETGVLKPVVSHVLPETADSGTGVSRLASAAPVGSCVVRVCSKKNCWRQGGRELWDALARQLAASGHAERIEIRQVGCLDRCKQAPNVDGAQRVYSHCSPHEAGEIIAQAAGNLHFAGSGRK